MLQILLSHYCAYSKLLKTLGHTDKNVHGVKFTNDLPIKILHFPIPQSLQKEAKEQIHQLLQAGIIERNWLALFIS